MDKKSHPSLNLVIEIGSSFIRGGYAGEPHPHVIVENKHFSDAQSNMNALSSYIFLGLRNLFIDVLQVKSKDAHVLIIEDMYNRSTIREALYHVLLQGMQVRAVSFQPDLCMPILATGGSIGIVLDIGSCESRVLCIAHGRPILSSFQAIPVGTNAGIRHLHSALSATWPPAALASSDMRDIFTQAACYHETATDLMFPDGKVIPSQERYNCLQELVCGKGEDIWDAMGGCAGLLLASLVKCDPHLRKALASCVILTGGGACIAGIADGICSTANEMVKKDDRYSSVGNINIVLCSTPFVRSNLTWMGGSVFASIKSNRENHYIYASDVQPNSRVPDWLSTNADDWKFFRPRVNNVVH